MCAKAHDVPEALENPGPDLLRRCRSRIHYRECGQRCQWYLYLLVRWGTIRASALMDHDSSHYRSDRDSGNRGSHGGRHRQRVERPDPGRIRVPNYLLHDDRNSDHQLRQCRRGVRRHRRQPGAVWFAEVLHSSHLRDYRVANRGKGPVQDCGESISGRLIFLHHLHLRGRNSKAGVDGCNCGHGGAATQRNVPATELSLHGDWCGGHHDCPLDAVLSAVLNC